MANKGIESVISFTDGFSKTFRILDVRLRSIIQPVEKLNNSFKRLDRVSGFRQLRKNIGNVKTEVQTAVQAFAGVGTSLGIVVGAASIAVSKLSGVALVGDKLLKTSNNLGLSVEALQKFNYVAELNGVPVERMQKNMAKLSLAAHRAGSGVEKESKAFAALHIKVKNINGSYKSTEELLMNLSEKFAYSGLSSSQKIYAVQELFGEEGLSMIELLNQGPEALQKNYAKLEKYGIWKKEQAEAAAAYNNAIVDMHWALRGLGVDIGVEIIPTLTKAIEKITETFSGNKEKYVDSINKVVEKLPDLVDALMERLPGLMELLEKILSVIGWITDKVGLAKPLGFIVVSSVIVPITKALVSMVKVIGNFAHVFAGTFSFALKKTIPLLKKGGSLLTKFSKFFSGPAPKGGFASSGFLGALGLVPVAIGVWLPTIKLIEKNFDMLKNTTFDDLVFCIKEVDKSLDGVRKTISEIPIIGSVFKGLGSLVAGKVDFSEIGGDDIGSLMLEAENPSVSLQKSGLFQSVTSTVNRNTNNNIDVTFHNVPDSVNINRRGPIFNDSTMYGNNMSPAF